MSSRRMVDTFIPIPDGLVSVDSSFGEGSVHPTVRAIARYRSLARVCPSARTSDCEGDVVDGREVRGVME